MAVGLGNVLYTWSEGVGSQAMHTTSADDAWLTSVAFSSAQGEKSILAIGRANGSLVLKSLCDSLPRFEVQQPYGVACVSWRPTCVPRPSKNPSTPGVPVQTEELVVGDETGMIYYYVVEWPLG
jgi:meiosis-specific APC/C activator protein AMA1